MALARNDVIAVQADGVDEAYSAMRLSEQDIPKLAGFLELLRDGPDAGFRDLILEATVLDTTEDIENQ